MVNRGKQMINRGKQMVNKLMILLTACHTDL